MRNKILGLLGSAVLVLTTGGCANSSSAMDDGETIIVESDSASDIVAPHIETLSQSPLAEYMSLLWNLGLSRDEQQRELEARNIFIQETAATCMHEQGFEYYLDLTMGVQFLDGDPALWHPEDREWVAQWGYGQVIAPTRNPWTQSISLGAASSPNAQFWVDPENPTPQQWAWQQAFHGGPDYVANPGCWPLAQRAFWDNQPSQTMRESDQFRPLFDAMEIMNESLGAEIGDYEREWIQCMADAGYPNLANRWDAQINISSEIWRELSRQFADTMTTPFIIFYPGVELTDLQAELQQREIDVALADFDCRVAVDFENRDNARRWATETQFVADHRPALEALRDTVEQLSAGR